MVQIYLNMAATYMKLNHFKLALQCCIDCEALTNKVSQTPPIVPEVVFRACEDLSNLSIVDKDGKSIVPPSRKPHVLVDVSVLNYKLPDPTQWRVGRVTEVKDATC